jgi:hypothetical protein
MRIACIHVPQYALQCATRLDPSLRGAPVAMVAQGNGTGALHAPIVVACSRAAWALGVRLGMTAAAARNVSGGRDGRDLCPAGRTAEGRCGGIDVVAVEPLLERETLRAIADAMLALTGVVDAGGRVGAGGAHLALYAEVPAKTRGNAFGERVLERLAELGLTGRVGIADDRFTAWVAAAYGAVGQRHGDHGGAAHDAGHRDVITVPRGGSAAFLAPRPLSLLAISPEVQHMLEVLGVRTLGEFAALPAPSVARPLEADLQALARGDSGTLLRPYAPESALREDIVVRAGNVLDGDGAIGAPSALALLAHRVALRLAGRGRGAVKLEVAILAGDATTERALEVQAPLSDADELARVLTPLLELAPVAPWRMRVVVTGEAVDNAATEVAAIADAGVVQPPTRAVEPRADSHLVDRHLVDRHVVDPVAVVLATSGSLFALSPDPGARPSLERAHRRTRRGKQRRLRPAAALGLFDRAGG